eukprot:scaffold56961_cov26-Tisochrysis_lutea.AAC.4
MIVRCAPWRKGGGCRACLYVRRVGQVGLAGLKLRLCIQERGCQASATNGCGRLMCGSGKGHGVCTLTEPANAPQRRWSGSRSRCTHGRAELCVQP